MTGTIGRIDSKQAEVYYERAFNLKRDHTARSHSLAMLRTQSYDCLSLSFTLVKQEAWLVERRAKCPVGLCLTIRGIRIRGNEKVYEGLESASPLSIRFDRVFCVTGRNIGEPQLIDGPLRPSIVHLHECTNFRPMHNPREALRSSH